MQPGREPVVRGSQTVTSAHMWVLLTASESVGLASGPWTHISNRFPVMQMLVPPPHLESHLAPELSLHAVGGEPGQPCAELLIWVYALLSNSVVHSLMSSGRELEIGYRIGKCCQ